MMTEQLYQIADINILIKFNYQISIVEHFKPFEVISNTCDVVIIINKLNNNYFHNFDGYKLSAFNKKNNSYIYTNNSETIKICYKDKNNNEVIWKLLNKVKSKSIYNIEVSNLWKKNGYLFDPFMLINLSKFLFDFSAILIHASIINFNGKGILFSAPSGTGKSTQANLWKKYYNATIINGDRAIIRNKINNYIVYGSPYAGSSHIYLNEKVNLNAIIVLRQSKTNNMKKLNNKDAYISLVTETFLYNENYQVLNEQIEFILNLIQKVPVYLLECKPDKEAVDLVYDVIKGGNYDN